VEPDSVAVPPVGGEAPDWTWPPYAPVDARTGDFDTEHWASATCVRRPWLRLGHWTLLYRRAA
jgi:hypothetical protein